MGRGFGASASGKSCCCKDKNHDDWYIVGNCGKKLPNKVRRVTVQCNKCYAQWDTNAKYTLFLKTTKRNELTWETVQLSEKNKDN